MFELTGKNTVHICVDVQRMFAELTPWHAPWLSASLPAIEALADRAGERTIFTRFVPPRSPRNVSGAWQSYFSKWSDMTLEKLAPELVDLVPTLARFSPPAKVVDKSVYSPWFSPHLIVALREMGAETLVVTGGETDVCVAQTVMGAIDHGFRVVLPTDAVFGSADATHDAMLAIFRSRFALQLSTCSTEDVLDVWED